MVCCVARGKKSASHFNKIKMQSAVRWVAAFARHPEPSGYSGLQATYRGKGWSSLYHEHERAILLVWRNNECGWCKDVDVAGGFGEGR
jgi:hypothetical protein